MSSAFVQQHIFFLPRGEEEKTNPLSFFFFFSGMLPLYRAAQYSTAVVLHTFRVSRSRSRVSQKLILDRPNRVLVKIESRRSRGSSCVRLKEESGSTVLLLLLLSLLLSTPHKTLSDQRLLFVVPNHSRAREFVPFQGHFVFVDMDGMAATRAPQGVFYFLCFPPWAACCSRGSAPAVWGVLGSIFLFLFVPSLSVK